MTPLSLLRSGLRQANIDFAEEEKRATPLPAIQRITKMYTDMNGQQLLEPVDNAAIGSVLTVARRRQPRSMKDAMADYLDEFRAH